ncbi:PhzF family phenazine biosynthesis protein [Natronorarus salvus]|uniref:PhzF family phenazine biosynthesis protein n=1 Tax=Natronorarus salvus TaxID=3117733 RepID=UPI002F268B56
MTDRTEVRACLVDAFTDEPLSGNVAGVVPDATGLSDEQCRAVARELNASETAFLTRSDGADRRIRYFTPTTEVDLCGHATVAAHALLREDGAIGPGTHTLETNVGVLDIDVEEDGTVWMTQDEPVVEEVDLDPEAVAETLGIDPESIETLASDLPIARASTGLPFLVVPVDFLSALGSADPEMDVVKRLCESVDTVGLYAFTFDTLDADSTLHGRAFVPSLGIPEDPVTGTASGAVGGYLAHVGAFSPIPDVLRFEQGHYVDRPGTVRVRVGEEVRVGGRAVVSLDGTLSVPEPEADGTGIIEA